MLKLRSPDGEKPKGGNGKSPAVGINNIPLRMNVRLNGHTVMQDNMPPDGEKPKGSLRNALKENSPYFPIRITQHTHTGSYSHKFDSKGNRSEVSWFENLWLIALTFLCFFIAFMVWVIEMDTGSSSNKQTMEGTAREATKLILFVVGICLLLCVRLYRVKFNYDTRICEISYFRFPGNSFFPSRQARIPFDQIVHARSYFRKTCCGGSYYVSLVLDNKTSVRVTAYKRMPDSISGGPYTIEEKLEIETRDYVDSFNKFIINILHNKELQIEVQKKRKDSIKELW